MKTKNFISPLIFSITVLCLGNQLHANMPVWTFTPITDTTIKIPTNSTTCIQYTVTNQSSITHTLTLQSLPAGITQITKAPAPTNCPSLAPGASLCTSPFTLGYQQSCTLTLEITGSALSGKVTKGPVACQANTDGTPNPNQCYQPSKANSLNITTTSPTRAKSIIIGDIGTNFVLTFPATGTGNIVPTDNLSGSNTGIISPYALFIDHSDKLWVSNWTGPIPLTQFNLPATGNVTPLTTIAGSNTTIQGSVGVGEDFYGNLYVADYNNNAINVFAPGASGNAAPIRQIIGSNTHLDAPEYIAVTQSGTVFVANSGSNFSTPSLVEFAAGANGNVAPIRNISGSNTTFIRPTGLWIDFAGNFWVADSDANSILKFAPDAVGNVAPIVKISGANTMISFPYGVAIDGLGFIYIGSDNGQIKVFAPTANGNVAPIQTIAGGNTLLDEPVGLTIQ
ncbi:NHL repeat protein [Legionella steigerwaltii]|uniref:NHL repeat protein n=1 Tax=Legionella steigerwaltii TaxID=460 RepID=A0A378L8J8_9GAMM|nr:hypothetical protein [Legionella steigerwaltii]KTD77465.1 NHL repeat protein [Legionella steigerwaltii]STY22680.1 NHL repeat protein [Legionella steigerwaltii]